MLFSRFTQLGVATALLCACSSRVHAQIQGLKERPTYAQPAVVDLQPHPISLPLHPKKRDTIAFVGGGLGQRLQYHNAFEPALQASFPELQLRVRNLCNSGDTPGLRPHASRPTQWAFPGADAFHPKYQAHRGEGHFPSPDEWLALLEADIVIGMFGYSASFAGEDGLPIFEAELRAWINHTLTRAYNGETPPRIVLVTPIAFEDRSDTYDLPDGSEENRRLELYSNAILRIAKEKGVGAVDAFGPSKQWYAQAKEPLTVNGCHLNEAGYRKFGALLLSHIFGKRDTPEVARPGGPLFEAVMDKNFIWENDYRMVNGVHAYGRRWMPYGNVNYPIEVRKLRDMERLRDQRIWKVARTGKRVPEPEDPATPELESIRSNYLAPIEYLGEEEALATFTVPEDYALDVFASEIRFPDLANPVQLSFDNRGRLWVAVMPSYPHYRPGGPRPNDKLLILEDTDKDGRADKQTVFADGLHLPIGFQLQPDGSVIVSQQPTLVRLRDTDGDDQADEREILLTGFDTHDTHHAIGAFETGPSGALFMAEGAFLHSQVETPYGTVRGVDAHIWRFDPRTWRLEKYSSAHYWNPWGIAFDEWGQPFVSDASNGHNYWLEPLSIKMAHGDQHPRQTQFTTQRVRPTSGTEFLYSSHFPADHQGDFLINNTIGFLGAKQHTMVGDGSGYTGELRLDLVRSTDPNFRPVDLEIGPDGSLYLVDWHNALVGHMQHSARDPNRDKSHGRIYRLTNSKKPLATPPDLTDASIDELLDALKLPEYRTRQRARRELLSRSPQVVLERARSWMKTLGSSDADNPRHLLEALWLHRGFGQIDQDLLNRCLTHENHKVRSGAMRVVRSSRFGEIGSLEAIGLRAASDPHPRVRLEAIALASWLDDARGARILLEAVRHPVDIYMGFATEGAFAVLEDDLRSSIADLSQSPLAAAYLAGGYRFAQEEEVKQAPITNLSADEMKLYELGKEVYGREGHCATCHQPDGQGLGGIYPGLSKNKWVTGDNERLIKIVLKGLWGPIEVNGKTFDPANGVPPMTAFESMLTDEEVAGVLTYIRSAFGNRGGGGPVSPEQIARVREETDQKSGYYTVEELLNQHPFTEAEAFVED